MGHYTGHNFRVILKADAPEGILDQLRDLAGLKEEDETALPNPAQLINSSESTGLVVSHDAVLEMLADISYNMNGWSAYIDTWHGHNKLELLDDGRWLLYTKCSNKWTRDESIKNFLNSLLPFMDMEEGDVLFRSIYEEGTFESIYYLSGGEIHYKEGGGYYYFDSMDDDEHPGNDCDVDWDPPMNIGPLREAVAAKLKKHPCAYYKDPWAHPKMPEDMDHTVDALATAFPFVIRPVDNDLPETVQRGYARKEEVEINGQKYIQYHGPFTKVKDAPVVTGPGAAVISELGLISHNPVFGVVKGEYKTTALDKHVADGKLLNGGLELLSPLLMQNAHRGSSAIGLDYNGEYVHIGMGRYYSEVDDFGQQGYAAHIEYAYYEERRIRSVRERMRPAKAKRLAKLKRYMDRVVVLARPLKPTTGTEQAWVR